MIKRLLFFIALLVPSIASAQPYPNNLKVSVTPTITTTAYTTGFVVGGKLSFLGAARTKTKTGWVVSAAIADKSTTTSDMELWLYDTDLAAAVANNTAFAPTVADNLNCIGIISFGSATRFAASANGMKVTTFSPIPFLIPTGTTLYGVLVVRGTPTFVGTSDLTITLGISQD
jgi:hypothetical protein